MPRADHTMTSVYFDSEYYNDENENEQKMDKIEKKVRLKLVMFGGLISVEMNEKEKQLVIDNQKEDEDEDSENKEDNNNNKKEKLHVTSKVNRPSVSINNESESYSTDEQYDESSSDESNDSTWSDIQNLKPNINNLNRIQLSDDLYSLILME